MSRFSFHQGLSETSDCLLSYHLHQQENIPNTVHFLHGNGFAVRTYEGMLEKLIQDENLLLQDAAGHGLSPAGPEFVGWNGSAARFHESLTRLREQYHLGSLIGMGHSFGGCMTLLMSAKDPSLFRYNILLDPALYPPRMIWILRGVRMSGMRHKLPLVRQTERRRDSWSSAEEAFNSLKGRGTFKGWEDQGLRDYVEYSTHDDDNGQRVLNCPTWLEAAVFGSAPRRLWSTLKKVTTPTYILWGTDTYDTFRESYQLINRINPNVHLVEVKGGHCFMQQFPEQTAKLVRGIMDHGKEGIAQESNADFIINYDG